MRFNLQSRKHYKTQKKKQNFKKLKLKNAITNLKSMLFTKNI